jgi:hypothetical protein
LLLTLLAVPVFYSVFEDVKDMRLSGPASERGDDFNEGVGRRIVRPFARLSRIFKRKTKPPTSVTPKPTEDSYVDQASGD